MNTIKSRAAVAFVPNEPLKVVEIDVERPKKGVTIIFFGDIDDKKC